MRAAAVRPYVLRTVDWSLAVRRLPTTCETVPCRCSSPSFRPWQIDIQLVRALGLAMFAHFAVVFSM